jgi:hypothetical protein
VGVSAHVAKTLMSAYRKGGMAVFWFVDRCDCVCVCVCVCVSMFMCLRMCICSCLYLPLFLCLCWFVSMHVACK